MKRIMTVFAVFYGLFISITIIAVFLFAEHPKKEILIGSAWFCVLYVIFGAVSMVIVLLIKNAMEVPLAYLTRALFALLFLGLEAIIFQASGKFSIIEIVRNVNQQENLNSVEVALHASFVLSASLSYFFWARSGTKAIE